TARTKASFEQIFLHVVGRIDLNSFFIESLDVVPERFVLSLADGFQGRHCLWVSTGGGKVSTEFFR
ncbi:hypothetical protein A2U01_0100838, partial [Trifolium medium]|nr:hypothetical protein [Trifolium medium]